MAACVENNLPESGTLSRIAFEGPESSIPSLRLSGYVNSLEQEVRASWGSLWIFTGFAIAKMQHMVTTFTRKACGRSFADGDRL